MNGMNLRTIRSAAIAAVAIAATAPGCGGASGPARYPLSGTVTYDGEPVPVGFIHFVPDVERGNSGPAAGAAIERGRFSTPRGKGTVGGPHRVVIEGYDGVPFDSPEGPQPSGQSLFPGFHTHAELPLHAATIDFPVPAVP